MLLYIECKMGAAGDMLMSALYELLSDKQKKKFVDTMNSVFGENVQIRPEAKSTCGINGTHIHVITLKTEEGCDHIEDYEVSDHDAHSDCHEHTANHTHTSPHQHNQNENTTNHGHSHEHHHYSFMSVKHIIEQLDIDDEVKANAVKIYEIIGNAEAHVHNSTLENIHFHEVGSLDAMADVVGCCLLFSYLKPDQIICSPIHVGNGTVKCAHGILPVPAPATAEILKGIPYYTGNIDSELCTPTGAAILKYFVSSFSDMPPMAIQNIGYGIGNKEFDTANAVRVFMLEKYNDINIDKADAYILDEILEISCNLDDMTGEELGYAMDVLLEAGALDVFFTPIYMKKNRPAVMLSCLCKTEDRDKFTDLMFKHTTTRGVRYTNYMRSKLNSSFEEIHTDAGVVRRKISTGENVEKAKLEFDDLKKIANALDMSIADVRKLVRD